MRHQPSNSKLISKQETGSGSVRSTNPATSAQLAESQSVANLHLEPTNGNDRNVSAESDSSGVGTPGSELMKTIPESTPVTNPRQCTATRPIRSMARTGVPSSAHLLSINSASSDDEIKFAWTKRVFGKPVADYLAGQFNWQIKDGDGAD
jgi:hypothetical protein